MSYYDHAVIMAFRLGPWANKTPTEIDRDIEHAAMLRQRLDLRRPVIRGAVNRMLELLTRRWDLRSLQQSRMDRKTGPGPDPETDHDLPRSR